MKQKPLILRSGLTGCYYLVTSYDDKGDGRIVAKSKVDVTDQIQKLLQVVTGDLWSHAHTALAIIKELDDPEHVFTVSFLEHAIEDYEKAAGLVGDPATAGAES